MNMPNPLTAEPRQLKATGKKQRDCQSVMQSTCARAKQLAKDIDRLLDAAVNTKDKHAIEKLSKAKASINVAARDIKRARKLNRDTQLMPFKMEANND